MIAITNKITTTKKKGEGEGCSDDEDRVDGSGDCDADNGNAQTGEYASLFEILNSQRSDLQSQSPLKHDMQHERNRGGVIPHIIRLSQGIAVKPVTLSDANARHSMGVTVRSQKTSSRRVTAIRHRSGMSLKKSQSKEREKKEHERDPSKTGTHYGANITSPRFTRQQKTAATTAESKPNARQADEDECTHDVMRTRGGAQKTTTTRTRAQTDKKSIKSYTPELGSPRSRSPLQNASPNMVSPNLMSVMGASATSPVGRQPVTSEGMKIDFESF